MSKQVLWVIECTFKKRKGQPTEILAVTPRGWGAALLLVPGVAKKHKVPQSWLSIKCYRESRSWPK